MFLGSIKMKKESESPAVKIINEAISSVKSSDRDAMHFPDTIIL